MVRVKAEMREKRRIRPCRRLPHVRAASAGARLGGSKAGGGGVAALCRWWRRQGPPVALEGGLGLPPLKKVHPKQRASAQAQKNAAVFLYYQPFMFVL